MASKKGSSSGKSSSSKKSTSSKSTSSRSTSSRSAQTAAKKEAIKFAKQHKKGIAIFVCCALVLIFAVVLIVYFFFPEVYDKYYAYASLYFNDSADDDPAGTPARASAAVSDGDKGDIVNADYSIHFLELGNKYAGDCTLIKCGDTEGL